MATAEYVAGFNAAIACVRDKIESAKVGPCFLPDRPAVEVAFEESRALVAVVLEYLQAHVPPLDPERLVLYCPAFGKQHIDQLEPDGTDWSTKPHRKHLCKNTPEGPGTGCGHLWRPKETPTVGVIGEAKGFLERLGDAMDGFTDLDPEHTVSCHADSLPAQYLDACAALDRVASLITDQVTARWPLWPDGYEPATAEQLARVRLGAWLAEKPHRSWSSFHPDVGSTRFFDVWTIKLTERGTDVGIADGSSWSEAMSEALRRAQEFDESKGER